MERDHVTAPGQENEGAGAPSTRPLEAIDALFRGERYLACLAELEPGYHTDPRRRWRYARALRTQNAIDRALLALRPTLAARDALDADEAVLAHALAVDLYGAKRCKKLAMRALGEARERLGDDPRLVVAEARLELALDERTRAAELLEKAPPTSDVHLAFARLHYIRGEFGRAAARLDLMPEADPAYADAVRLRSAVCAAQNDFAGEAQCWRRAMERAPESDRRPDDWLNLGFALAAQGRRDDARTEFLALWRALPETGAGRYARSRSEALERAAATATRKNLTFPTTSQKRNFCGPAVLEICLRYLGIELGQDEIAADVKRETGTPMFEIARFLEDRGIEVRRVVVTPERIRAAIDLGLPIILQEEYSTTSHVAAITGYDDALQVLLMQDPMTHRISTRPFDWSARAGQLYGSGGVLVVGRKESELGAVHKRLEEVGLVDAAHLRLLDDCARRRPSTRGGAAFEPANPEEELATTDKAIAIDPTFRLAWLHRWYAKRALYLRDRSDPRRYDLLEDLYHVRTTFPDDEWPCQLHGRFLVDEGRHAEAFAAYLDAHLADEGDGNNLTRMGEGKRQMGMLADAEKYLLRGLENYPDTAFAEWVLVAVYVRSIEVMDEDARRNTPNAPEPFALVSIEFPRVVKQRVTHDRQTLLARATHMNEIALELEPLSPFHHEMAGLIALRTVPVPGAAAERHFHRALEIEATRWMATLGLASALEAQARAEEARPVLQGLVDRWPKDPDAWSALTRFLGRRGEPEAHAAALARAIESSHTDRSQFVRPLFDAFARLGSPEQAAARLREIAEKLAADGDLLWTAANHLDAKGQRGHAIGLLRRVVLAQPKNATALAKLGRLLSESLLSRDEGIKTLERAVQLAPGWSFALRPLALHYLTTDPKKGLALLEPALGEESTWTWEVEAMLLAAAGQKEESERAVRRAIAAYDGTPARAIEALCDWHRGENRYDRAIYWTTRLFEHPVDPARRDDVNGSLFATYRVAGRGREILPKVRELYPDKIADAVAFDVFYLGDLDHELGARAAATKAATEKNPERALRWRIREARHRAKLGDESAIPTLCGQAKDSAMAEVALAEMYDALHRYAEANEAADRAYALAPNDEDVLVKHLEALLRRGRRDEALACARRLHEVSPYDHRGPERIAEIEAKSMRAEEARVPSALAVEAAPYCAMAQEVRALALFVAGDFAGAFGHARRCLALHELDEEDEASDALMIVRACKGYVEGVRRCLANLDRREPPGLFAEYRAYLLKVAGDRAREVT